MREREKKSRQKHNVVISHISQRNLSSRNQRFHSLTNVKYLNRYYT